MRDSTSQVGHEPVYLAVIHGRAIQIFDEMHSNGEVLMAPLTNCLADVKGREQRVAIH